MGHRSILTTQHYISAANTLDTTAADILDALFTRTHPQAAEPDAVRLADPG